MADRFQQFEQMVYALWPRSGTTPEELRTKAWGFLSRFPNDAIIDALKRHAQELPDNVRPNWGMIFRSTSAGSGSGRNALEILIAQYRVRSSDWHGDWCMGKSDHEVWKRHVECQLYSILFPKGSVVSDPVDQQRRLASAKDQADMMAAHMAEDLREEGAEVPPWISDVGIPERWLQAAGATT